MTRADRRPPPRGAGSRAMRPSLRGSAPSRDLERQAWAEGAEVVVGVDEVGRGAWAGPLTVAAVVVPRARRISGVRDSKALTEAEREALVGRLAGWCEAWAVGHASPSECDELGMSAAQRLAARRALDGLGGAPDLVLLDGSWNFVGGGIPVRTVVRGDATCVSIAAASVIAKVTRDRLMRADAEHFPAFELGSNKGYPCPRHRRALAGYGPTSIHRRSWAFMDDLPWPGLRRPVGPERRRLW